MTKRITCPRCGRKPHAKHYEAHAKWCHALPQPDELRRLVDDGLSQADLADMAGTTESNIQKWLDDVGFDWGARNGCGEVRPAEPWRIALCGVAWGKSCAQGHRRFNKVPTCPAYKVCQITKRLEPPWCPCQAPDDLQVGALLEFCWRVPKMTVLLKSIGSDLRPLALAGWALVLERMGR